MGIHSKFDSDFRSIDLASMADDMLAQVVADHARDRFVPSNRANAAAAGAFVPYGVAVDGRPVHRGQGEMFPERQVALVINPPGRMPVARVSRKLPTVVIDWAWERLEGSALDRALTGLVRVNKTIEKVEDPVKFARLIAGAANDPALFLLRFMLLRYARARFPETLRALDEVRALYRVYRIVSAAGGLLDREKDRTAESSVLAWIAGELRARSPVLSGGYRDAHELWADGRFVMNAAAVSDDSRVPQAAEYSFTNTVPYSRKIEFGKTQAGRDFVVQVPSRIYERTAQDAARRFRNVAEIGFEMRAVIGAHQTPQRQAWRPHNRPAVRYPSIWVRF